MRFCIHYLCLLCFLQTTAFTQDTLLHVNNSDIESYYSRLYSTSEGYIGIHNSSSSNDINVNLVYLNKDLEVVDTSPFNEINDFKIYSLNQIISNEEINIFSCLANKNGENYFITASQKEGVNNITLVDSVKISDRYFLGIQEFKRKDDLYYLFDNLQDEFSDLITNVFIELEPSGSIKTFELREYFLDPQRIIGFDYNTEFNQYFLTAWTADYASLLDSTRQIIDTLNTTITYNEGGIQYTGSPINYNQILIDGMHHIIGSSFGDKYVIIRVTEGNNSIKLKNFSVHTINSLPTNIAQIHAIKDNENNILVVPTSELFFFNQLVEPNSLFLQKHFNGLEDLIWENRFRNSFEFLPIDVEIDEANNLLIAGAVWTIDGEDEKGFILKIDSEGNYTFTTKDEKLLNIKLYPNPVSEYLSVELPYANNEYSLSIFNQLGACVNKLSLTTNPTIIDMSEFSEGIYYVSVQSGLKIETVKISLLK